MCGDGDGGGAGRGECDDLDPSSWRGKCDDRDCGGQGEKVMLWLGHFFWSALLASLSLAFGSFVKGGPSMGPPSTAT